ncbi:MAG: PRD domain-containing protein [Butyribacter sp.]|nr:PRD domain-containing protein [bacterium]MDY3853577.1 PRD domain-containing protein [Butyribacter sp.]
MYRAKKVLNHNSVIVVDSEKNKEYLVIGKGIGFGKKVSEYIETRPEDTIYSLQELTNRGDAKEIVQAVSPICLELANEVLNQAEKVFGKIDKSILFPMADHIEYAVKRIKNNEQISNPLTEDIKVLFHNEYKVAQCMESMLWEQLHVKIDEHEIGYIALHIHSAIEDEKVSQAMQMARAVRECISLVEEKTQKKIDVMSLSYNRLMNHVRYMVARAISGEKLKLSMNDYMKVKFPEAFKTAAIVCEEVGRSLKCKLDDVEIGYLAMHIERVTSDEISQKE